MAVPHAGTSPEVTRFDRPLASTRFDAPIAYTQADGHANPAFTKLFATIERYTRRARDALSSPRDAVCRDFDRYAPG